MTDIDINDYDYDLPAERIAQYPVNERDKSKLLIYKDNIIGIDTFLNIDKYIPSGSLLIFNNTRVIRARIIFQKYSGALIEILCLEPLSPSDYAMSFGSFQAVEWKCIVGNLKKWKQGVLETTFNYKGKQFLFKAERIATEGETSKIRFSWDGDGISFAEVIEMTGHIPLPPYITRTDEEEDSERYQTVYSKVKGSVAAPTAGLHFTDSVLARIRSEGIDTAELTLHVGAGTFQPIKSKNVKYHEMHCEHFSIDTKVIELLIEKKNKIIAVGTTSVRTLESLYWLGVKLIHQKPADHGHEFTLRQWEPYELQGHIAVEESLGALVEFLHERKLDCLNASTSIMIVPGYDFRMTSGMVTNFHQPKSTLLLLISAWTGNKWKELYNYAIDNGFRFLSYGDSSLLLK